MTNELLSVMSALYFYTTIIVQQVLLLKQDDFEPSLHDIHVLI